MTPIAAPPRLRLRGITKRYPSVTANEAVDLDVAPGEIHALLGENGAGKSTLMKIVYGVVRPDAGTLEWDGVSTTISTPAQARALGIGMVFQHFALFETLTVAENIALAMDDRPRPREIAPRIVEVSERYGLPVDPDRLVHGMSVGERQRVEIVRSLLQAPRLLIMDEPTSVLTPQAVRSLFVTLRRLAAEGVSILYISHKLDEIRELCDRATVLRGGRVTGTAIPAEESHASLARLMVGRELAACRLEPRESGETRLAIRALGLVPRDPFGTTLRDVDLEVRAGEIVGIAGVSGNGQRELLAAISGESRDRASGTVEICGRAAERLDPLQRRRLGLTFVPEERLGRGAVPELSLSENTLLTGARAGLVQGGFLRRSAAHEFAARIIEAFTVKGEPRSIAGRLSGGNLQKFIVGREIQLQPRLMVVAQPTWGVDVGAAQLIRQALIRLRDQGVALLVVSEELDELFEICDRLAVIAGGRLSRPVPTAELARETVGVLMAGGRAA